MHWGKSHFKKSGISKLNSLCNVQWNCKAEPVSFLVFSDLSCWAAAFWVPLERCQPAELSSSRDSIYPGWSCKPRHVAFAQVITGELYTSTASVFPLCLFSNWHLLQTLNFWMHRLACLACFSQSVTDGLREYESDPGYQLILGNPYYLFVFVDYFPSPSTEWVMSQWGQTSIL